MSKAELLARIEALEAEVALLRARPINLPWSTPAYYPYPAAPYTPQIWCGTNTSPGIKNTFAINATAA